MEMINRFREEADRNRLIWALRQQKILHDNKDLSNELADQAELLQFEPNEEVIVQGDADNDIYLFSRDSFLSLSIGGKSQSGNLESTLAKWR